MGSGDVLAVVGRPELEAAFSRIEGKFQHGWKGEEMVPQQPAFFTVSSRVLSKADLQKIPKGELVLLVVAVVKFSDSTGNYQQELCQWLQPPGLTPTWHE
jgi:hypothetical protein